MIPHCQPTAASLPMTMHFGMHVCIACDACLAPHLRRTCRFTDETKNSHINRTTLPASWTSSLHSIYMPTTSPPQLISYGGIDGRRITSNLFWMSLQSSSSSGSDHKERCTVVQCWTKVKNKFANYFTDVFSFVSNSNFQSLQLEYVAIYYIMKIVRCNGSFQLFWISWFLFR